MCHPSKSSIVNDPIVPYFTSVESFTNIYKFNTDQGRRYRIEWNNVVVSEIVQSNGIMMRDGLLGGSNGTLYEQFNHNSPMYIP